MARMFLLKSILEEAHALDKLEKRRQSNQIRSLSLSTRNDDYVSVYRLSKELIDQLEYELLPLIKTTKRRGKGLSARVKILCTLSFLANGSNQKIIKENIRTYLSQPSVSRCINEVVEALNNLEIPSKNPSKYTKKTNVKRKVLRNKQKRKNQKRMKNVSTARTFKRTDSDLNILNVDPTYGGATHDSFIFNYCVIKAHLEALTNAGEEVVLLGDSGYAQRANLMSPISGAEDNSPEAFYNDRHGGAIISLQCKIKPNPNKSPKDFQKTVLVSVKSNKFTR